MFNNFIIFSPVSLNLNNLSHVLITGEVSLAQLLALAGFHRVQQEGEHSLGNLFPELVQVFLTLSLVSCGWAQLGNQNSFLCCQAGVADQAGVQCICKKYRLTGIASWHKAWSDLCNQCSSHRYPGWQHPGSLAGEVERSLSGNPWQLIMEVFGVFYCLWLLFIKLNCWTVCDSLARGASLYIGDC